jgi:hypothetical protein
MDGDSGELRLVRLRCSVPAPDGSGTIIARDVDKSGRTYFVVVRQNAGGRTVKYAVDAAGQLLQPPLDEP